MITRKERVEFGELMPKWVVEKWLEEEDTITVPADGQWIYLEDDVIKISWDEPFDIPVKDIKEYM